MPAIDAFQRIVGFQRNVILDVTLKILLRFRELPMKNHRPERTGGFLALMIDVETGHAYFPLVVEVGACAKRLLIKAQKLAQEKCRRLHRMQKENHLSSWQSRNPDKDKYGGSITGGGITVAFSGLSEHQDEALVVVLLLALGWINSEYTTDVKEISQNPFIDPLINACADIIDTKWSEE